MWFTRKSRGQIEKVAGGSFMRFLERSTSESGKLREPVELILSGFLGKSGASEDERYHWIFSTGDTDRYEERIDCAGWELERYLENPVVLWAHNHSIPAIGKAEELEADSNLHGYIRFNDKAWDPFGWSIGERVKEGVIRAGSVGILVKEVEWTDRKKNPGETCELIIRKQELLEFSICNVPANPFALQKGWLGVSGEAVNSTALLGNEAGNSTAKSENIDKEKLTQRTGDPTACSSMGGYWPLEIQTERRDSWEKK